MYRLLTREQLGLVTKESEKERRRLASGQGLLPFGKIWTDLQRGIAKAFVLTANAAGAERRDADGDGRQPGSGGEK